MLVFRFDAMLSSVFDDNTHSGLCEFSIVHAFSSEYRLFLNKIILYCVFILFIVCFLYLYTSFHHWRKYILNYYIMITISIDMTYI
jgi:hypothetical protein